MEGGASLGGWRSGTTLRHLERGTSDWDVEEGSGGTGQRSKRRSRTVQGAQLAHAGFLQTLGPEGMCAGGVRCALWSVGRVWAQESGGTDQCLARGKPQGGVE